MSYPALAEGLGKYGHEHNKTYKYLIVKEVNVINVLPAKNNVIAINTLAILNFIHFYTINWTLAEILKSGYLSKEICHRISHRWADIKISISREKKMIEAD